MSEDLDAPRPEQDASPVIARDPDTLPAELLRGAEIPDDLDPLAEGILMAHQAAWLEDKSDLKLAEKGRRTGITFAEALDDTLIAAAEKGDNVFYIGDTKDKGREFIGYVAHFAKVIAGATGEIEEFLFEDQAADGSTRQISAYRVRFASGHRVEALSSRPENIRGLQGVVVVDEAAFHKDVRAVLDAVNALLIWGGKVRVISTHNGEMNPFNELIREAKAGKNRFSLHFIPFTAAVENGLYERVCYVRGLEWTEEAQADWLATVEGSYGTRTAARDQELYCVPAQGEGAALTRVQVEACTDAEIPVIRLAKPDEFKHAPEHVRQADIQDWCEAELRPVLAELDPKLETFLGEDFGRLGDLTVLWIYQRLQNLVLRTGLVIELRNVPFEAQKQVLHYVIDRLPRFAGAALDRTGNGQYLAEVAAQRFGGLVIEVHLSTEWYRQEMVPYVARFEDGDIIIPADEDIVADHLLLTNVGGVTKVPDDRRTQGTDGFQRHGDAAMAGALGAFVARQELPSYGYVPAVLSRPMDEAPARDDHDRDRRRPARGSGLARMRGAW